ncbi:hypothetical protein [Nocardia cyriacigeorgica]|nr:hypothetical protein [Nocardia cyriacigeorgica]
MRHDAADDPHPTGFGGRDVIGRDVAARDDAEQPGDSDDAEWCAESARW